jgi:hypothetical protein
MEFMNAKGKGPSLEDLQTSGQAALANTYESAGGHMPDPDPDKTGKDKDKDKKDKFTKFVGEAVNNWENPYIAFANAIMKRAPTLAEELREAGRQARAIIAEALVDTQEMFGDLTLDLGIDMLKGVTEATKSFSADEVIANLSGIVESTGNAIRDAVSGNADAAWNMKVDAYASAGQLEQTAAAAYYAAAADVKAATNKKQADRAMAKLKQADKDWQVAKAQARDTREAADRAYDEMIAAGNASATAIDRARAIVAGQAVMTAANVEALITGGVAVNATLTDYAQARGIVADMLSAANQRLADAIALRDNYAAQVGDGLRAFGSLLTAQGKTLNGIQQAVTADDITENMRERLTKIKKFRDDLRLLLSQGLSDSAYKQIVDAGVETGSAYAEAILAGGQGSVSEVNDLTGQIDETATFLGNEAANHMYQAGVAAAQGLVNGLISLSNELTTAAGQLGIAIANAIKAELGIASPSRVLFDMMKDDVGDGMVNGLNAAQTKVGAAASALAAQVAVSPEVAAYAAAQGTRPTINEDGSVSGNTGDPKFLWTGDIVTPTEDPHSVATEVLDELTGRLP